jgi:hypothetical protein
VEKNKMNHKIKNFLTFGLYDRLVKAECEVINLKSKISDLDIQSTVEDIIRNDGIVDDEIRNNFSPSDYDLVTTDDYDFDTFMNDDEVARVVENEMEDYREKIDQDIRDNISEMQGRFIKDTVKEICTEMLVDWCTRTAEAANKNKE